MKGMQGESGQSGIPGQQVRVKILFVPFLLNFVSWFAFFLNFRVGPDPPEALGHQDPRVTKVRVATQVQLDRKVLLV